MRAFAGHTRLYLFLGEVRPLVGGNLPTERLVVSKDFWARCLEFRCSSMLRPAPDCRWSDRAAGAAHTSGCRMGASRSLCAFKFAFGQEENHFMIV